MTKINRLHVFQTKLYRKSKITSLLKFNFRFKPFFLRKWLQLLQFLLKSHAKYLFNREAHTFVTWERFVGKIFCQISTLALISWFVLSSHRKLDQFFFKKSKYLKIKWKIACSQGFLFQYDMNYQKKKIL